MNKTSLGAFYTKKNPFIYQQIKQLPFLQFKHLKVAEPFAGQGDLIKHLRSIGFKNDVKMYDINPQNKDTIKWDSLKSIPKTEMIITNPPWLSLNIAKSKKLKVNFFGHNNLWKRALELILSSCSYALVVLPQLFIRKGLFQDRLISVTTLPFDTFLETEHPSCLAVFGPKQTSDFAIFKQHKYIGQASKLKSLFESVLNPDKTLVVQHHVFNGNLGFKSIGKMPSFCLPHEIVQPTSNHYAANYLIKVNKHVSAAQIAQMNQKLRFIINNNLDVFLDNFKRKNCLRVNFWLVKRIVSSVVKHNKQFDFFIKNTSKLSI